MTGADDPAGRIDALVAALAPGVAGLAGPGYQHRDAVLVTGPPLAGVDAVTAALHERLPGRAVVAKLPAGETPTVVVFVVSAAADPVESDWALLDAAAAGTDAVVGVISKIDLHRHWRRMLQLARDTVSTRAMRYRAVPWVAVAAAPAAGPPDIDDLVTEVDRQLGRADLHWRNRARAWERRLRLLTGRYQRAVETRSARVAGLRQRRGEVLRQQRLSRSQRTVALRGRMVTARLELTHLVRCRCAGLRAELHHDVATLTRPRLGEFEACARGRIDQVLAEVDRSVVARLAGVAADLGLASDDPPAGTAAPTVETDHPPLRPRSLETQLTTLVGAGFGLGMALMLSRVFANLTAGLTAAGAAVCALVGLLAAGWMVSTRALLQDRAVLDRWVTEAASALRAVAEQRVAVCALATETSLMAALALRMEAENSRVADQIAALDAELRSDTAALPDQQLPAVRRALTAVRIELGEIG